MLHMWVWINHSRSCTRKILVVIIIDILINNKENVHIVGVSHQSDRLHPTHHPIDLSSRTDSPVDEINLLSKRPSFWPIPRDINWYKCRQEWQAFVDKMWWADFHFDREHIDTMNTSDTVVDLGPFKVKSHKRAPVSKDIAWETFLATVDNKLFDVDRASYEPKSNISKAENKALCKLRCPKIWWLECRTRALDLLFWLEMTT